MLPNSQNSLSILAAAAVLAACGLDAASSAKAATPVAATPSADALLALEKQAHEARIRGDGKFFEGLLSDKFVASAGGVRLNKAEAVKMISGNKCDVNKGWALTEPQMLKIDNDAYVLSYVSDMQGHCTADGKTKEMPGPVRAATIWVRNREKWHVAFHGENLIVDPAAPPAPDKKTVAAEKDKAAVSVNKAGAPASAQPAADSITDALMATENALWDAWKDKDAKRLEDMTARDIAFVDYFGTYFAHKAETIKDWTGPICDVSSFRLTNGVGTSISPTVGILTLTGTVNGACGGKDISGQKIHGNSVYVKDGGAWKWVFGFNSPT